MDNNGAREMKSRLFTFKLGSGDKLLVVRAIPDHYKDQIESMKSQPVTLSRLHTSGDQDV